MKTLTIQWERIGRNHNVPDLVVAFDPHDPHSVDALEAVITQSIRRHLSSRFFDWSVDLYEDGPITIDGGRFGRGAASIAEVPS